MGNALSLDFDGDSSKARQEVARLAREVAKLKEQNTDMARESKKHLAEGTEGANQQAGAYANMANQLGGVVVGMVSIGRAMSLIRTELADIVEKQQKSLEATQKGGSQLPELIRNLPPGTTYADIEPQLQRMAATGVPGGMEAIIPAAAAAFTAAGEVPAAQTMAGVGAALGLAPEGGESLRALAVAATKLGGVKGGSTNPKELLGMTVQGAQAANITDLEKYAENANAAALSLMQAGSTQEQGIELAAALSHIAQDVTGRRTASLAPNMAKQLREFVPEARSPNQAIEMLIADPQRGREVFSQMSFESRSFLGLEQLLTGGAGSDAAKTYFGVQSKVESGQAALDAYDRKKQEIENAPAFRSGQLQRQLEELTIEQFRGRPGEAAEFLLKKSTSELLQGSGEGGLFRKLSEGALATVSLFQGPEAVRDKSAEILRMREAHLLGLGDRAGSDYATGRDDRLFKEALAGAPVEAQRQVELLEKGIERQDQIITLLQQQQDALRQPPPQQPVAPNAGVER